MSGRGFQGKRLDCNTLSVSLVSSVMVSSATMSMNVMEMVLISAMLSLHVQIPLDHIHVNVTKDSAVMVSFVLDSEAN